MEKEIKPIKRSEQLAPLSREHHDGLLFAWKIKQGLVNKASLEQLRNYTMWYWRNHIKQHFFQEEKILLPYMPTDHPMAIQLKEEHDHIRELVLEIDEHPDSHTLQILCDLLNKHIRFEERELFIFLEALLTKEQLDTVYVELEKHPVNCDLEWTDEFWVRKQ